MKKFTMLFALAVFATGVFGQTFTGVGWVNWTAEPDYTDVTGYAANPYNTPEVVVPVAPEGVAPDQIADVTAFDAAWDALGVALPVSNLTSNGVAGDLFDLDGAGTFGAEWKGVHDGSAFYLMLKYYDTNSQADDGSLSFEIMAQPTSHKRHEPSFLAAADSAAALQVAYENMAYARIIELGGGKATFANGVVGEYAGSIGTSRSYHDGRMTWRANWGSNDHGLEALALASHFWDATDGVIRAIMVMTFDGALGYPTDPLDLNGDYTAVKPGDTIAFDVKANANVGGTDGDNQVQYFWAADKNNGYASNYYSGHVIFEKADEPAAGPTFTGVGWVNWTAEPDYADVTGYAANPYNTPTVDVKKAPANWSPISDVAGFDATWDILGDENLVSNLTSNGVAGDPFDLGDGNTYGASWKGVHDGSNFYLLLKYMDVNGTTDDGSMNFEIMAQPASPARHEPSFLAAADSAAALQVAYENMAYARIIELGGGKATFADGVVGEYAGSIGLSRSYHDGRQTWRANWGSNDHGLEALALASHFWDKTDGVIKAVMVMSFDGALGYPADPTDLEGTYNAIQEGETFAFDVKANATIGGTEGDNQVQYFWSADKNNGYASNYYSGHLTLSTEVIGTGIREALTRDIQVYVSNDMLNIRGVENTDVKIYSISGALVKAAQNVSRELSLEDLNSGLYIVKLGGVSTGFKVVK